jgi:coenzyme F420 hydrogenase subunit beta
MDVPDPAGKTWFRDLDEAVIEADRCVQCGSCVAACPSDSIGIDATEGRPTLVKMCTGCSRCWDFCPRSGLRSEAVGAAVADAAAPTHYTARARAAESNEPGENGGAVTALLVALLRAGEIDGAVVAESDDGFAGEATLATSPADLREAAGSLYSQPMQLGRVADLVADSSLQDPDLALVGTPCVAAGARALDAYGRPGELGEISLVVSLFCTASFETDRLRAQLASHGVDPEAVASLSVVGDAIRAVDAAGEELLATSLDSVEPALLRGCQECADFTGETADISAGTVGSPQGSTTLVVRTERGEEALETASEALDLEPADAGATESLAAWNERRASETLPRELDPDGPLTIPYADHRAAFDGTPRAPEPLNRARVYQYEEWC